MDNPTLDTAVLSGDLRAALANVKRAINPRTKLPILSYGMIETDNGRLTLSATNLEWAISYTISARVEGEGSAVLPVHQLAASLPAKPTGPVHIIANGKDVSVTLPSGATLHYHTADPDDWPNPAMPDNATPAIAFGGQALKRAIEAVERYSAPDQERPILAGVLMQIEHDEIVFVAADSYRLAVYHYETGETFANSPAVGKRIILPATALRALAKMIGKGEGDVTMWLEPDREPTGRYGDNHLGRVTFTSGDWRVTMQQTVGVYPDWRQIIPKGKGENVTMSVADTLAAVKALAPISKLGNDILRFSANGEGPETCTMTAKGDGQTASLPLPCHRSPNPWRTALNSKYLRDLLETIGGDVVCASITSPEAPVYFIAHDEPLEAIIMPMYVAD